MMITESTRALGRGAVLGPVPAPRAYSAGAAWGMLWRYAVFGVVTLAVLAGPPIPVEALVAVGVAGVLLGLWHRRSWPAALWRAALLGWATAATTGTLLFPVAVLAALTVVTVEPWLAARSLRRSDEERLRAILATTPGRTGVGPSELPPGDWPVDRRRRASADRRSRSGR